MILSAYVYQHLAYQQSSAVRDLNIIVEALRLIPRSLCSQCVQASAKKKKTRERLEKKISVVVSTRVCGSQ